MKRWIFPAVLGVVAGIVACSSPMEHSNTTPFSITVTPPVDTLPVSRTAQLSASALDQAGQVITGVNFTWSSSDPAIATVDNSGVITALAPGSVTITAVAAGRSGSATVLVSSGGGGPLSITLTPLRDTLAVGATVQLAATARDSSGGIVSGLTFTWSSSNSAVARVGTGGLVTAVAAGQVTVLASSNGQSGGATIVVTSPVADTTLVRLSTFLAGSGDDQIRDMTTDASGNIYVAGGTSSNDFPTTAGAFDRSHDDSPNGTVAHYDGFISKFDSTGHLLWSTFLGGPGYDRVYAMEVAPQGYVYVAGRTGGGLPITAGAAQTTFEGGSVPNYGPQDGFVCKFNPSGSAVVFCTYFGTTDQDIIRDIDLDPQGNVYLASSTGVSFPASLGWFTGSYQPTKNAGTDGVVAKLSADGSTVLWATYIGGSGTENAQPSIRVDGSGNVWYLSVTNSTDMPLVNPTQSHNGGGQDLYLAKFSPDGKQLLFGTYLGGGATDGSETHNLAINRTTGDVYVGSTTASSDIATTAGALQPNFGGGPTDGIVARFSNGGSLLMLSYLGGGSADGDDIQGIAVGSDGRLYVSGSGIANRATVPFYGNSVGQNGLAMILAADLKSIPFAAAFGGNGDEAGRAVAVAPGGGIIVGGTTASSDFPLAHPYQSTYLGSAFDSYFIRFHP